MGAAPILFRLTLTIRHTARLDPDHLVVITARAPFPAAKNRPTINLMRLVLALLLVAACGRTLTPAERTLTAELMGDTLETSTIRMTSSNLLGLRETIYPARPQVTCRERINPPPDGPTITTRTAGVVLFETVVSSENWTLPDYLENYPTRLNLAAAMYFAHEMTHVWQWQNRAITQYHPLKAAAEHATGGDPYLFDPDEDPQFLNLGYEQQSALVEEYVCCRTLDPTGTRTSRLRDTLRQVMPVTAPRQTPAEVAGVWEGTDIRGICS